MTQNGNNLFGLPAARSRYLDYLPPIYAEHPFLDHFLLAFERILAPIEQTIDNFDLYLDPHTAPVFFLDELASWLGLVFDETWPAEKRRLLLAEAIELYGRRGTRRGLSRAIEIYAGVTPHIFDELDDQPHRFNVVLYLPSGEEINQTTLEYIIEANKPAHTTYTLHIFPAKPVGHSSQQNGKTREEPPHG